MASITLTLSTIKNKDTGKSEILLRYRNTRKVAQRAHTHTYILPKYFVDGKIVINVRKETPEVTEARAAKTHIFEDNLNFALGLDDKNRMPNGLPISQHQFDALLSFTYNVGTGNLARSTLLRKVKANPRAPSIRGEFSRWVYGGGKRLPGLVRRRKMEAALYFS